MTPLCRLMKCFVYGRRGAERKTMNQRPALLGAVSLIVLSAASSAFGQSGAGRQDGQDVIVVKGSRLGQTATEVGSSVSIITADDIEKLGFDFAIDAIAAAPGVTVNANGPFGGQASVRIRGAASEQTLVLIDGVPVNDASSPGGGFNFARLDTENIERIEILKGAQSTLWGTDAIGGVVSITTKRPTESLGGSVFTEYGSFDTFRGGASIESAGEQGDFRLAVVGTSSDGISKADENNGNTEDDAYEALTLSANGGINLPRGARLSADVLFTDAESEFDSFTSGAQGSVGDGDEVSDTQEIAANISLTGALFDGRLENLVLLGYSDISRENFTNGVTSFDADGERMIYRYQGTLAINDQNTLAFGAEREETEFNNDDIAINGFFGLYEFKPVEPLTLTGGLRVDDHETFGSETTGRFAAAYNPNPNLTLRASWGQGFKAPTLIQLTGGGFTEPNPDLQPETSEAFDAGVDWRSDNGAIQLGVTVFDTKIEDLIQFSSTGYFNEPEVETRGVEVTSSLQLSESLSVSAAYAYIEAEDGDGDDAIRLPEHSGDVTLTYDPEGPFSGAMLVRYNGEELNRDRTKLDSWTRVDLSASYELTDQLELFSRIENLFNEEYQQILGYGTPDRSGFVGIRLRY
ncbi:MAG: TonB-dependent receptor [Pseudomonadota bacterium]